MIETRDSKNISALKAALLAVRDDVGGMRESADQAAKSFADQAAEIAGAKSEALAIKDSLSNTDQAVRQVSQRSEFNLDAIGLLLSKNIIAGLHDKISLAVDHVSNATSITDARIKVLSGIVSDAIEHVSRVEQLAADNTSTDALSRAIKDTQDQISAAKNESKQSAKSLLVKQSTTADKINQITHSVDKLRKQLQVVADAKSRVVTVQDADTRQRLSLKNRGSYSAGQDYTRGDIVRHINASWLCIDVTRDAPDITSSAWAMLAQDGAGGGSQSVTPTKPSQEFYNGLENFPAVGQAQILYFDISTNPNGLYIWSGTEYQLSGGDPAATGGASEDFVTDTIAASIPTRRKTEIVWANKNFQLSIVNPINLVALFKVLGAPLTGTLDGSLFIDTVNNKLTAINQDQSLFFKLVFRGVFAGGGGTAGRGLSLTFDLALDDVYTQPRDQDPAGDEFAFGTFFSIDKDGFFATNGCVVTLANYGQAYTIQECKLVIEQMATGAV